MNAFDDEIKKPVIKVLDIVRSIIGSSIRGIYLFGSAVSGGLQKDSDLDILIVNDGDLEAAEKKKLIEAFMEVSGKTGNQFIRCLCSQQPAATRLFIFWLFFLILDVRQFLKCPVPL